MNPMNNDSSDNKFKILVDSIIHYAIFILDIDGNIQSWNAGAERFKGYKSYEVIGKHFSIFYTDEDKHRNHPAKELKIATLEGKFEEEGWRVRKDGSVFWANVVISKLMSPEGKHIGFSKVTSDLTERKNAQEKLKQSEEQYRLLLSSIQDYAIFMLSPEGIVTTWNEGAEKLKGYSPQEIIGKHFSIFYPAEEGITSRIDEQLKMSLAQGRFEAEGMRVRKDGSQFWANVIITAIKNDKGEHLGFTKITRDISERKKLEEELRKSNKHLDKKVKERTIQLEKAVKFRDEFISIVSHELRTPVTSLKLQIQTALRQYQKDPPLVFHQKSEVYFRRADKQLQRMTVLINDILDISKLSMGGKIFFEKEPLDLNQLALEVITNFEDQAQVIGCSIHFISTLPVFIEADRVRLEQVLSNLISNAFKYGNGKDIEVKIETKDDEVSISVRDHGIGIAPEDQKRIFHKFERATKRNIASGIGVGLYICKNIIKVHGGKLSVKSELGKGSIFTVVLKKI